MSSWLRNGVQVIFKPIDALSRLHFITSVDWAAIIMERAMTSHPKSITYPVREDLDVTVKYYPATLDRYQPVFFVRQHRPKQASKRELAAEQADTL